MKDYMKKHAKALLFAGMVLVLLLILSSTLWPWYFDRTFVCILILGCILVYQIVDLKEEVRQLKADLHKSENRDGS